MKRAGAVRNPGPHIPYRSSERAWQSISLREGLSTGRCVTRFSRQPHRLYPLIPRHQRRDLVVANRSSRCDGQDESLHVHVVGRLQEQYYVVLPKGQEGFADGDPKLLVGWSDRLDAVLGVLIHVLNRLVGVGHLTQVVWH